MNLKSLLPLAFIALTVAPALASQNGQGQAGAASPPTGGRTANARIGVANPSRIFNEMQETRDVREKHEAELKRLLGEEKERQGALQKLQSQRNQLKPETPQWETANNELMDLAGEHKLWLEQNKARLERTQKRQMRQLFQRIEQAIAEIAQRDGYDVVMADQRPELPEDLDQVNFGQLRALINSRNVLYASPKVDMSDAVIALLDGKYKAKGGGAAPAAGGGGAPRRPTAPNEGGGGAPRQGTGNAAGNGSGSGAGAAGGGAGEQ